MRLVAAGEPPVDTLTTHTIPREGMDAGIKDTIQEPDKMLGVASEMAR